MKILVTGGCGNMGPHIIRKLVEAGNAIRVLDKDKDGLAQFANAGMETCCGDLADKAFVESAIDGSIDAIIHLAWSFSDNLPDLLDIDVKGYQYLLDAAIANGVEYVVNTTTAVSYGKPLSNPVVESQAHLVEQSRNPVYALAKLMTEELTKIYAFQHGLKVNTIDAADWGGSAFLTDDWPLSIEKAEKILNFRTNLSRDEAIANLSGALKISVDKVRSQL